VTKKSVRGQIDDTVNLTRTYRDRSGLAPGKFVDQRDGPFREQDLEEILNHIETFHDPDILPDLSDFSVTYKRALIAALSGLSERPDIEAYEDGFSEADLREIHRFLVDITPEGDSSIHELRHEWRDLADEDNSEEFYEEADQSLRDRKATVWRALRARVDGDCPECPEPGCESDRWGQSFGDPVRCADCGATPPAEVAEAVHRVWREIRTGDPDAESMEAVTA